MKHQALPSSKDESKIKDSSSAIFIGHFKGGFCPVTISGFCPVTMPCQFQVVIAT